MEFLKKFFLYVLPPFYVFAGTYHFIDPEFYLPVMPHYIMFPEVANYFTGAIEIALGICFIFPSMRRLACLGIVVMLLQFIPVHIDFIALGSCVEHVLCVPEWMGYARLLVVHPLLIYWAWSFRNNEDLLFGSTELK